MTVRIVHPLNPNRPFYAQVETMTEAILRFGTESEITEVEGEWFVGRFVEFARN